MLNFNIDYSNSRKLLDNKAKLFIQSLYAWIVSFRVSFIYLTKQILKKLGVVKCFNNNSLHILKVFFSLLMCFWELIMRSMVFTREFFPRIY